MIIHEQSGNKKRDVNFHFEYSLESQRYRLEGKEYIGFGISAKMVDEHGTEEIASISDITSEQEVAYNLLRLLNLSKVSPMCLKMFVVDFLTSM